MDYNSNRWMNNGQNLTSLFFTMCYFRAFKVESLIHTIIFNATIQKPFISIIMYDVITFHPLLAEGILLHYNMSYQSVTLAVCIGFSTFPADAEDTKSSDNQQRSNNRDQHCQRI